MTPLVTHDAERSTAWSVVYHCASDSKPGRTYTVVHHTRDDRWTCGCRGASNPRAKTCRHRTRAELWERRRWWKALMADYTDTMLRGVIRDKASIERVGLADNDDLAALDAAEALLAERAEEAKVA